MIQVGIMAATGNSRYPFSVVLRVNPRTPIAYCVGNHEELPSHILLSLNCGEKIAGVFDFVEDDQFAYYVPVERIAIKPIKPKALKDMTEEERKKALFCEITSCPDCEDHQCTSIPPFDCPE